MPPNEDTLEAITMGTKKAAQKPTPEVTISSYRMNENCEPFLLFTIPCFNEKGKLTGYATQGEKNAYERAVKIIEWMGLSPALKDTLENTRGTVALYHASKVILNLASDHCLKHGTRCPIELRPELVGLEGKRVEATDGGGETRRFYVGKSTGWLPCHLEILRSNSHGGGAAFGPYTNVRVLEGSRY
jgi:hypothetical protein